MQEMTTAAPSDFMRSREVMELARISRRTLDRWTAEGLLPVIKQEGMQRRYRRRDVLAVLDGRQPEPP